MNLKKIAETKWVKLFTRYYKDKTGKERLWDFCSRKENPDKVSAKADAVVVVPFIDNFSEKSIVVIKQFRPALNDYIIECVAGLIDEDECTWESAVRELKEETGLNLNSQEYVEHKPIYNSPGITDENCSYVFGTAYGKVSKEKQEDSEDIEILILNKKEASELLLSDVKFSAKCWLILKSYAAGFDWI